MVRPEITKGRDNDGRDKNRACAERLSRLPARFCIGIVVVAHYRYATLPGGAIGVSVFFALSGYLITQMLLKAPKLDWATIWRFLVRRFFRVYPPMLVAVGITVGLSWWTNNGLLDTMLATLPELLTFGGNTSGEWLGMGIGVLWTLQVEFMFYLCLPLIMLVVGRGKVFVAALCFIAVYATLSRAFPELLIYFPSRMRQALPWFDTLIFGSLVAVAESRLPKAAIPEKLYFWASRAIFAGLLLVVLFVANDDRGFAWHGEALIAAALTAIWIYLQRQVRAEPNFPIVAWVGRISYALYLFHPIPLDYYDLLPWFPFSPLQYSKDYGLILLSVIGAVVLHYGLEIWSIRLGRRLTK
jgi:peptidoglycan/LPS O-acetylase OafA/YrhL